MYGQCEACVAKNRVHPGSIRTYNDNKDYEMEDTSKSERFERNTYIIPKHDALAQDKALSYIITKLPDKALSLSSLLDNLKSAQFLSPSRFVIAHEAEVIGVDWDLACASSGK